jgi:hypothetical protein
MSDLSPENLAFLKLIGQIPDEDTKTKPVSDTTEGAK